MLAKLTHHYYSGEYLYSNKQWIESYIFKKNLIRNKTVIFYTRLLKIKINITYI